MHPTIFDWLDTFDVATLRRWAGPLRQARPCKATDVGDHRDCLNCGGVGFLLGHFEGLRSWKRKPLSALVLHGPPAAGKSTVAFALQAICSRLPLRIHDEQPSVLYWSVANGPYAARPQTAHDLDDGCVYTANGYAPASGYDSSSFNVEFNDKAAMALRGWCWGNPVPEVTEALRFILMIP
jgi:hypothetical protein